MSTMIIYATRQSRVSLPKTKKAKPETKRPTSTSGFSGRTTKDLTWQCVEGCGACCKLAKDFAFATPDEIFENPDDVELYRSMIGNDGWCINYDKSTRKCSIIQIVLISAVLSQRFFSLFTGLKGKNSTRKLAAVALIPLRRYMALNPKN